MRSILLIPAVLLLVAGLSLSGAEARTVRVGLYGNEPMLFSDEDGAPVGFYVDVLEHVASGEGWELSYVAGRRSDCMTRLRDGDIDILPGIGLEPDSSEYVLTRVCVLSDWGQIYSRPDSPVETLADAAGGTIAAARDDAMYRGLRAVMEEMGLDCHFVEVDGYGDALDMVRHGVADACVVPRLFAAPGVSEDLARSALVGPPVELRFAVSSAAAPALAHALDARVTEMRRDHGSPYYEARSTWFGEHAPGGFAGCRNWALVAAMAFLGLLLLTSILHRRRVKEETRRLQDEADDLRCANDALKAAEGRLRTLYDRMNEGVCLHEMVFDEAGRAVDYVFLDVNPSYEAILGRERDKIVGKRGREVFDSDDIPFLDAYADVVATGHHSTFDAYFPPARRHFRVSVFSPEPGKVAAIMSDVTESKEEMDELKTSEGKYRILFENAPDAMYLNDLSGNLVDGNRAAEKLLGYKKHELVGENILKAGLIPLEQTLKAANNISLCAQGKPTGPDEFTLVRKDGGHVDVEISTHPVKIDGQTLALGIVRDVTARKHAERSLREYEERLRAVFESVGAAVIVSDVNGEIEQVNRSAVGMLGYASKEELIGCHASLCIAEEDRQRASEDMMRALKTGDRVVGEYRFLKRGGGGITCRVDIDVLKDRDGNAIGFVMLGCDITDRKERERAMLEDVSKYRSLLEGLDEAVFRVTLPIGKYDYVSPSVEGVFGYTAGEFLKNPLLMRKLVHPDHARYFNDMWKDLIQGHIQPSYEYKIVDRGGREKWVLQTNRRVFNEAGKVTAIEGVWRDVTEHKQVDDSLRENEEHFRLMFEAAGTALQFYDAGRTLVHANDACLDLFGVDDIGRLRKLNLLTHESAPADARRMLEAGRPAAWRATLDFTALREGGVLEGRRTGTVDLEIAVSPLDTGGGSPTWYLAEIRDAVRAAGGAPQSTVLDAAAGLAKAMAQDFNDILTGIMGYSEHLAGELAGNESLHGEAEKIRKAAEKAVARTRQLLTFSRSAAVKSVPLDLNAVITQCRSRITRALGDDKKLEVNLDPSLGEVRADRRQIETILENLASNAGEAMPAGGTMTIETSAVDRDGRAMSLDGPGTGHFARLTVSDDGPGIPPDVIEHIFEPFFTTREGRAGMGLSVVYGSVKQHGGWIEVASPAGKGAEFALYFPARPARREEAPTEAAAATGLAGSGQRILIVEDDEIVRSMAAKVLRDRGYTVFTAATAAEARERFREQHSGFDLVFCDIALPDDSGLRLAAELHSERPDLSVLLSSGYADKRSQAADLGKDFPLLEKPYALFDLLTAVKDSLGQPVGTP